MLYLKFNQPYFLGRGQTGTQANINTDIVRDLIVALPPLEEQQRITDLISAHDEDIRTVRLNLNKLQKVKKGLMHDLLTGRVRLKR